MSFENILRCKAATQIGLNQLTSKFWFHPLKSAWGHRGRKFSKYEAAHECCQHSGTQHHLTYHQEQRKFHEVVDWISLQGDDSSEEIQMHLHGGNFCKQVLHSSKEINVKVSLASDKKRMSHISPISFQRCYLSPSSVL